MAHLWFQGQNEWVVQQLFDDCANVSTFPERFGDSRLVHAGSHSSFGPWSRRLGHASTSIGRPVVGGGLRVSNDRDLIRTPDGARYFFSSESLAEAKPFPGADRPVICWRCRMRIDSGSLAVCCPEVFGLSREQDCRRPGTIQNADEVITYHGERHDLLDLSRLAGIDGDIALQGEHIDMQEKVWAPIVGSGPIRTYDRHFTDCPECPFSANSETIDDYEVSNRRDVYVTLKLWELWKEDKLRLMGHGRSHHSYRG